MCEIYLNLTIKTPEQRCFGAFTVNFEQISRIFSGVSIIRSSHRRYSIKKVFLEISQNSKENICARISFFWKKKCRPVKKTLTQVFSCEFCKISKTTLFTEHLWTTASHHWTSKCRFRNTCLGFIKTQCLWYTVFSTSDEPNS